MEPIHKRLKMSQIFLTGKRDPGQTDDHADGFQHRLAIGVVKRTNTQHRHDGRIPQRLDRVAALGDQLNPGVMQVELVCSWMKGRRHQLGRDQGLTPLVRTLLECEKRKVPGREGGPPGPADHLAVPTDLFRNHHDCLVDWHQLPSYVAPGAGPDIRAASGLRCHLERRRRTVQAVGQGIPLFGVCRDHAVIVKTQAALECLRTVDI